MWTTLSLQTRLSVLFCTLLLGTFALVLLALFVFSINHLEVERAPAARLAAQVAGAVNAELRTNPSATEAIVSTLRRLNDHPDGYLYYREAATDNRPPAAQDFTVPQWFRRAIGAETETLALPIDGAGELTLYPTDAPDVYEKWLAFLITLVTPLVLGALAFGISRITVQAALQPLQEAVAAISRLRQGDYDGPISVAGPPEVKRTFEEISALAGVLSSLKQSNRAFMKRIVIAQDDERAEIGRDLHDEFAPLLFAARANAHALQQVQGAPGAVRLAKEVSSTMEAIQKINNRLLARLRPLDLENLGLARSIAALGESPAAKAAQLSVEVSLDPGIDRLEDITARTIYRFVQEALTNAIRHAGARTARIRVGLGDAQVQAEVIDDGAGFSPNASPGRGLGGMTERIAVLGGEFQLETGQAGTTARCTLPL